MKKYYIIAVLIIGGFLAARAILLQQPKNILMYTVQREDLVDSVQVSGTYTTATQHAVVSPTKGIIRQLYVQNSDLVKKNTPLFYIESTATADQKATARTNYLAASAAVAADKATLFSLQSTMYGAWKKYMDLATNSTYQNSDSTPNTTNRILTEFTTAQDNWWAAEANYKNQQSIIAKDEASFAAAKLAYDETQSTKVVSPADGVIVNLLKKVGDGIEDTTQPVLIVANLGQPYLTATVSEDYAARVAKGQHVEIVFDALKEKTFSGTVEQVDTVGTNTNGIVTYNTRIVPAELDPSIKPNMTALITIETLRKDQVIDVPNSAIMTKKNKTYVQDAKTNNFIEVTLGTKGITKTEITSGLEVGATLVANPEL